MLCPRSGGKVTTVTDTVETVGMVGKECRATLPDAAVCAAAGRQEKVPQMHKDPEITQHVHGR